LYKKHALALVLTAVINISIFAQTHISIPLGHPVYLVLEQAQMRGLCTSLPATKPYSRSRVLSLVNEILNNDDERRFGRLTETERIVLEQFKNDLNPGREGFNLTRGTYSSELLSGDFYFSSEFGFGMDMILAGAFFPIAGGASGHPASGDFFADVTVLPYVHFLGDLDKHVSYGFTLFGYAGKSPRSLSGEYNVSNPDNEEVYRPVFGEPHAYFPYAFKKRWDGFLFAPGGLSSSGQLSWPRDFSLGYAMMPELSASLLNDHVFLRFARIDREWAGMSTNGSLVLSQSAQPFLAIETVIRPFGWISFSSLTGVLEFDPQRGEGNNASLKESSQEFQNAFSIVMLEASYNNYFNMSLGSSVVWPKRFELGYLFPFAENFLYQNNVGDFDNLALFLNLQGQYPGIGRLWFSLFLDEVNIAEFDKIFEMDRMMYAFQIGGSFNIPFLPFASVTIGYTKVEPYNYTHGPVETPWHSNPIDQNYVNFGRSLGHYLPPNSDEILVRFETVPVQSLLLSFQYQMIRHGADYGDRAVDGSSLWSVLPDNRGWDQLTLRKYFLRDGAYQWMHIARFRGEYSLTNSNVPMKIFAELGGVYSYFTDIDGLPNSGSPGSYSIIDTPQYPKTFRFIGSIGLQIFPKF